MHELSWFWVGLAATLPMLVGWLVATPLWRTGQPILGNLAGTMVMFGAAVALILRERIAIERAELACIGQGFVCWPEPSAFTRFAVYAFIALFEVIALFIISLRADEKYRRRGYAPEWR
jgi:hypothetical protein